MAYKNKVGELRRKKAYYRKNREKILRNKRKYYRKHGEIVKKRLRLSGKKWYQRNKRRIQLLHRKYYRKNKERVQRYHKRWYRKNKGKLLQCSKEYYQKNKKGTQLRHRDYNRKNKTKILGYKRKWQKHTRKINPKYRLDENMGSAICRSLKDKKAGRKWEILVNYDLEELMKHLEKQFDGAMSWDNYGNYWAVDHIKPRSLFSYSSPNDPEFKQCWALNNLQPLEKIENIRKNNIYPIN